MIKQYQETNPMCRIMLKIFYHHLEIFYKFDDTLCVLVSQWWDNTSISLITLYSRLVSKSVYILSKL